jgi:hypothetical protein
MRVEFDEERDRAKFIFVDDARQTRDGGYTEAMYVTDASIEPTSEPGLMVQVGFETPLKLLWLSVEPASLALPRDVLAAAERRR